MNVNANYDIIACGLRAIQGYGCKLVHFQLLSCLGPRDSVLFIEVESAFRGSTVARSCDFSVKKKTAS